MSLTDEKNTISYRCTCGLLKPISLLYFCRHCFKLRCGFCVFHEIDTRFCALCSECVPAAEAWMKKNCCPKCFQCPMCENTVNIRISNIQKRVKAAESEQSGSKQEGDAVTKVYYLHCSFCHWSSRDSGIPDVTTTPDIVSMASDEENPNFDRIAKLTEYYTSVSINDRLAKEKKSQDKSSNRRPYIHISGLSAASARKYAGLPPLTPMIQTKPDIEPSLPVDVECDLPDDIYSATPDLMQITTLQQRFCLPSLQPTNVKDLRPFKKSLSIKISRRCRACEHHVTRPEYNPNTIKFKIQQNAYLLVPNIRIDNILKTEDKTILRLFIVNPMLQHSTTIRFLPIEDYKEEDDNDKLIKTNVPPLKYNAKIIFPENPIQLPARDDAAEYDDSPAVTDFNDDPKVVTWRKGNKIIVNLPLEINSSIRTEDNLLTTFVVEHVYTFSSIQQEPKQFVSVNHAFPVVLDLGKQC